MKRRTLRSAHSAFTLVELVVAMGVGSVVALVTMLGLTQGTHLFKSNETEMWARENGSQTIRAIHDDIVKATSVKIYTNYQYIGGAEAEYGSCIVVVLPENGRSIAYYRSATPGDPTSGRVCQDLDTSSATNPLTDKQLLRPVGDLEFRRNPNGTIRIGFDIWTLGYPRRTYGAIEADKVRYTTSALPRNL